MRTALVTLLAMAFLMILAAKTAKSLSDSVGMRQAQQQKALIESVR